MAGRGFETKGLGVMHNYKGLRVVLIFNLYSCWARFQSENSPVLYLDVCIYIRHVIQYTNPAIQLGAKNQPADMKRLQAIEHLQGGEEECDGSKY